MVSFVLILVKNLPVSTVCDTLKQNVVALLLFCGRIAQKSENRNMNLYHSLTRSGTSISFLSMRHQDQWEKHGLWDQIKLVLNFGSTTYQQCDLNMLPNHPQPVPAHLKWYSKCVLARTFVKVQLNYVVSGLGATMSITFLSLS